MCNVGYHTINDVYCNTQYAILQHTHTQQSFIVRHTKLIVEFSSAPLLNHITLHGFSFQLMLRKKRR